MASHKNLKKAGLKEGPFRFIGVFPLGNYPVSLVTVDDSDTASFNSNPSIKLHSSEAEGRPRILVGLNTEWLDASEGLIHEALELILALSGSRMERTNNISMDYSAYFFAFDHATFTQAVAATAQFITPALPRLAAIYNKHGGKNKLGPQD